MDVIRDIEPTRAATTAAQGRGQTVGLVPTMGALHEGHLSLVRAARQRCAFVAVTIFVNPTQFGPGEDFEQYPRAFEDDARLCEAEGVDLIFAPAVETMYPSGSRTTVHVSGLTEGLCGAYRPGHFDGVATVCAKLFSILPADYAFFGEKDYQQMIMIRQMARDLNLPMTIVPCATVREADGLAMSSRNRYLTAEQRRQAASLSRALFAAGDAIAAGEKDAERLTGTIRRTIREAGPCEIQYVEVVDPDTLEPMTLIDRPARICLAVRIGTCRLIDNVAVAPNDRPDDSPPKRRT